MDEWKKWAVVEKQRTPINISLFGSCKAYFHLAH